MSRGSASRAVEDDAGAVLIEFALTLPLLLLIVVAIFDFGFLFHKYLVLTNAVREGARMAVLTGYSIEQVQSRVVEYSAAAGVPSVPPPIVEPVSLAVAGGGAMTAVQVSVPFSYTFTLLGPIAALSGGTFGTFGPITITSVMRVEVAAGGP